MKKFTINYFKINCFIKNGISKINGFIKYIINKMLTLKQVILQLKIRTALKKIIKILYNYKRINIIITLMLNPMNLLSVPDLDVLNLNPSDLRDLLIRVGLLSFWFYCLMKIRQDSTANPEEIEQLIKDIINAMDLALML